MIAFDLGETDLKSWGELVGRLVIKGQVGEIDRPAVFVDSWLYRIWSGLRTLASTKQLELDIDEPSPLILRGTEPGIWLKHEHDEVWFASYQEFVGEVAEAVTSLVQKARTLCLDRDGPFVAELEAIADGRHMEFLPGLGGDRPDLVET
jgi:hypothetical protein